MLVLHTLYHHTNKRLRHWLEICPRRQFTTLDTHDGMGVVDVRTEKPQSVDEIAAIAGAGAQVISPSRIAMNPDCGFAPDFGEPPSIDEAFEKLSRLVQASNRLRDQLASE